MSLADVKLDEIGNWSEIKLDIVRKYATAYSTVLASQGSIRSHTYIDAFAGAGYHFSKTTKDIVLGSPVNALYVNPPFTDFHFIDMDGGRAQNLREAAGDRKNVNVYEGDCNSILLKDVFPKVRYSDYRRALCLLDPYGLNLQWEVMKTAGQEKSIEIFLNFMVMDMNMNVLLRDTSKVRDDQLARMNGFWGDESWREAAYTKKPTLFGSIDEKTNNDALAQAFRKRLKDVAGFAYVPDPLPMKNSLGRTVYYLYFASPNNTGAKIVTDIFNSYRDKGGK
jgi:three-Cys-motif partner protein